MLRWTFDVRFPEDEQGAKAQKMVDRLIQLSEQKDCTVSRTVEHPRTFRSTTWLTKAG